MEPSRQHRLARGKRYGRYTTLTCTFSISESLWTSPNSSYSGQTVMMPTCSARFGSAGDRVQFSVPTSTVSLQKRPSQLTGAGAR